MTSSSSTHDAPKPGSRFGGFDLLELLGQGGAGTVYKAFDRIAQADVALKLLHPEACANETARVRFLREFRAIARLRHPHCLNVLEEGQIDGLYYYTMEFVEGGDLEQCRGQEPLELFELLHQVASALAHIHSHRIVHRDLKPQNILIDKRGAKPQIKLADFGIAKLLDQEQSMTRTGMIMGTVGYMAPEQIRGEEVDPRTDLYALGCMIHELFVGHPPFISPKGIFEVLRGHLEVPAPSLQSRAPSVPDALDELTSRLLAKDPAARPQSALAVIDILAKLRDDPDGEPTTEQRAPAFIYRPALVGRDRERNALLAAIDQMHVPSATRKVFATLCAPAGMGKTRLIDALMRDLKLRGSLVIHASVESDPDALFAPFSSLEAQLANAQLEHMRHSAGHSIDWSAETIQPGQAPAAKAAFESFSAQDPDRARRARAARFVDGLRELGQIKPTILIIEDLHEMKASALELLLDVLGLLASQEQHAPALILTTRPGRQRQQVIEALPADVSKNIDLEPLSSQEVEQLLGQMLGQAQDVSLIDRLVSQVLAQTEGNPLFVQAYLQNIVEQNVLKRTREGWTFEITQETQDLLPRSMAQVLSERLALLDERTYGVLRAAAACGRSFDFALLRDIVQADEGEVLDAIDEALRNWIIRSIPGPKHLDLYTFDHAKFVDVLYAQMSPSRQRSLHQRIGTSLEMRQETSAQVLATHFARGEDPAKAQRYLSFAGKEALEAHDHATARDRFEAAMALELDTPQDELEVLLEGLADAQSALGEHKAATQTLNTLISMSGASQERALVIQRARKLGNNQYLDGQTSTGIETLEAALEEVGQERRTRSRAGVLTRTVLMFIWAWVFRYLSSPTGQRRALFIERARIHRDLLVMYYWLDVERSSLHQLIYLRLAERLNEPSLLVEAYASHLVIASIAGLNRRFVRYKQRAQALGEQAGDVLGLSRVESYSSVAASFRGDREGFMSKHQRAMRLAEEAQDRFNLGFTMMSGGWCATLVDEFAYSRQLFERTVALGDALGSARVRADGLAGLAAHKVFSDEPMLELAQEITETGQRLGIFASVALGHETQGAHYFFAQKFELALESFERARDLYEHRHLFGTWGYLIGYEYAESLLNLVDERDGKITAEELAKLRKNIRISFLALRSLPTFTGFHEVLQGSYEARRGKTARAQKRFERALKARAAHPKHYLTGWLIQRVALERARLGLPAEQYMPLLDQYDEIFKDHAAQALRRWGARNRALLTR